MKTVFRSASLAHLALSLLLSASSAMAGLVPLDFAVRDAKSVHGVLFEQGVFLGEDTAALFSCTAQYGEVTSLLWTSHDAHAVTLGSSGVWLTAESGCHWRRTTGAVDGQRVVGYYQPTEGSDRVVFAVDDDFGATAIMETADGGFTSNLSGSLAVSDASFVVLGGQGDVVALGARTDEGALRTWWSDDAGESFFVAVDLDVEVSGALAGAGYALDRLWLWDDDVLYGVDAQGAVSTEVPPVTVHGPVAGTDGGVLWLAAGPDGLWRRDADGAWERVQDEDTRSVKTAYGQLWVARSVDHAGAPVILRSDDGGVSWWPAWLAPDTWTYPATCETSLAQQCGPVTAEVREGLGLPLNVANEGTPPEPPAADDTGCSGTGEHTGWPVLACLCVAFFVISRWQVPGSP
jgi:hypothetical protein